MVIITNFAQRVKLVTSLCCSLSKAAQWSFRVGVSEWLSSAWGNQVCGKLKDYFGKDDSILERI